MVKVDLKTVVLPLFPLTESARISLEYYRQQLTSQEQQRIRYICNSTSNEVANRVNEVLTYDEFTPSILVPFAEEIIASFGLHGWAIVNSVLNSNESIEDKMAMLKNDNLVNLALGIEACDRVETGNSLRLRWVNELLAQKV